jgi:hypothetical protein
MQLGYDYILLLVKKKADSKEVRFTIAIYYTEKIIFCISVSNQVAKI